MRRELEILSARPATAAGVDQLQRMRDMQRMQLNGVRAVAQNWRNGVGLATIAGGSISFLAAPDVLKAASRVSIVDGAHLLLYGAIFTVIAVVLSMRASFGWPIRVKVTDDDGLRRWEARETNITVWLLRVSMIFTGLALVLFTFASAVLVFGVPFFWHFADWV